jgi:hypothetical protein
MVAGVLPARRDTLSLLIKQSAFMIRTVLKEILQQHEMIFFKNELDPEYVRLFLGSAVEETEAAWIVHCHHILKPPAMLEDIVRVETALGYKLPAELVEFLSITNGAWLYRIPGAWAPDWARQEDPEAGYTLYHVFSTTELVTVNRNLLSDFRSMLGEDPDFRDLHTLNYIAFCDAHDGNYLAILLEGPEKDKIFFLDHEYLFRPYSELDVDLYYTIAESLEAWLELVVRTKGRGGFGKPSTGVYRIA